MYVYIYVQDSLLYVRMLNLLEKGHIYIYGQCPTYLVRFIRGAMILMNQNEKHHLTFVHPCKLTWGQMLIIIPSLLSS